MIRIGQVIGMPTANSEQYEQLHSSVWPEVLRTLKSCNVQNYSIFKHEEILFAYMEYVGDDLDGDMERIAADPKTQEWWSLCGPLQRPVPDRKPGEWWKTMPEIFHME
jgi:L-rhamnose mutarotase